MTRNAIESAIRRLHTTTLSTATLDVYEPSVTYSAGDGFSVSYPGTPTATYDARVESPSDDIESDRSGTTAEIDALVRVRDDVGQQWTGFGEEADAPARVEDTETGTVYEVQGVEDAKDGLATLNVAEA